MKIKSAEELFYPEVIGHFGILRAFPHVIKQATFQEKWPTKHMLPLDTEDGISSPCLKHPKPALYMQPHLHFQMGFPHPTVLVIFTSSYKSSV